MRLRGLEPVIDKGTRVVILGTFPSAISLARNQYYANPTNQFWKVIGCSLGHPIEKLSYEQRVRLLLASHLGLWDVIESCERSGSSDKAIRSPRFNDFTTLCARAPQLIRVAFNGTKATEFPFDLRGLPIVVLPSTSSANTHLNILKKAESWQRQLTPSLRAE